MPRKELERRNHRENTREQRREVRGVLRPDALAEQHDNLKINYVYSEPMEGDVAHDTGFFDQAKLRAMLPANPDMDVYFLGPKPFMQNCQKLLNELGIPAENQRYEFFGPLEELSA